VQPGLLSKGELIHGTGRFARCTKKRSASSVTNDNGSIWTTWSAPCLDLW